MSGKLVLCATPIGNLGDISERAVAALAAAGAIACEDTRRARKLLSHLSVRAPELIVYNEATERRRTKDVVRRIASGEQIVLISDAGMPGLSDPGYRLVRACIDAGLSLEVVPGPSAAVSALVLSGLPAGRFAFEGFLPRKPGDRRKRLQTLSADDRTLVFYESPHRIAASLSDMADVLGDRPAALARELTKMYEEVRRGSLAELRDGVTADPPRGEIVIVVGGAVHEHRAAPGPEGLATRARMLMDEGMSRKDALTAVAAEAAVPRRAVFDALVAVPEDD